MICLLYVPLMTYEQSGRGVLYANPSFPHVMTIKLSYYCSTHCKLSVDTLFMSVWWVEPELCLFMCMTDIMDIYHCPLYTYLSVYDMYDYCGKNSAAIRSLTNSFSGASYTVSFN
jgi:hypothetical protein